MRKSTGASLSDLADLAAHPSATGRGDDVAEVYSSIVSLLWNEREALEHLLYKLVQEHLLLTAGRSRWLNRADTEVADAIARVRSSELLRAAEMEQLTLLLGLPLESTLAEIAECAPEPWALVLSEHRVALRALAAEVKSATTEVRVLLNAGASAIRDTIDSLTVSSTTYDARGAQVERDFGSLLLDAQA